MPEFGHLAGTDPSDFSSLQSRAAGGVALIHRDKKQLSGKNLSQFVSDSNRFYHANFPLIVTGAAFVHTKTFPGVQVEEGDSYLVSEQHLTDDTHTKHIPTAGGWRRDAAECTCLPQDMPSVTRQAAAWWENASVTVTLQHSTSAASHLCIRFTGVLLNYTLS